MRRARYEIVQLTDEKLVLRDLGPWDFYLSITNDADHVVMEVAPGLKARRLFYYDSEGDLTELKVVNGKFAGFL